MPRIPEPELERLKNETSVARLVEASGLELKKSGKDWITRCPFHEDDTASLVVTPGKNLWHCFGCGIGGGPIDWVMKRGGVSFRHAVEQLREGLPALAASAAEGGQVKRTTVRSLTSPVPFDADDQALLNQTASYYHERLLATTDAREYLAARGLGHPELVEHFKLGVADRTLGLRLPEKNRKAGGDVRAQLQRIGLYRESGHEHFNGSLIVPVFDEAGNVVEVYGRKLLDNLRAGTPKHLYLPTREGRGRGVFNIAALQAGKEIILCEALIDALTFWCAGFRNVTSAYGIEGFTAEHIEAFKRHGTERVLIAYDRDEAGERGAAKVAEVLMAEGIECWRIQFPKGMDANAYARQVLPADKSLGLLVRKALWLGKGPAPMRPMAMPATAPATREPAPEPITPAPETSSLAAASAAPVPPTAPWVESLPDLAAQIDGDTLHLACGARTWQVRGLPAAHPGASLKLNVRVQQGSAAGLPVLHVDSVDLYSARSRAVFAAQAAAELGGREHEALQREIGRELGRVLLAVEQAITAREREAQAPKVVAPVMSEAEQTAALAWLQAPDLLARIAADFDACGLVGEATNKLTAYLACVSRLLERPLALLVQSSSAAGKTSLMDAVLAFMPEEVRIRYSAMTGQSLYYMGQTSLKHRILALAEEEGAARASYALKLLQSDGELTMAATGKDPTTGALVTQEYHVEGPVMLMLTTTAIDIDEELMNRCLVLTVDESAAQTRAIHARQRERRTLAGLLAREHKHDILSLHRHAQQLLRPLAVVNPYAEQLSFHAQQARARRDHEKYLALIDTIALLHQHQREIHQVTSGERCIDYIEVTRSDIEAAHAIAHEVLGRSLDELPPVTRKLLATLSDYVAERAKTEGVQRDELRFTRRELREACGWGDTQLRLHLQRLAELEILNTERMGAGGQLRYTLRHEAGEQDARTRLCGLIDPAQLKDAAMTEKSRGSEAQAAGPSRGDRGPDAGAVRAPASVEKPATARPGAVRLDASPASPIKADPRGASSYLQAAA
jgi:DNA primase